VIRWFEEHRIPIDVAAGTSMGGLIGGSFATGMDAAALQGMLRDIDWDEMFGFSSFAFENIRRKADARAYPSRLEFGLKKGIVLPTALNSGAQVDQLIAGITAAYHADPTFETLPTPFKMVAVDLRTAQPVILDRGSLARSMRANTRKALQSAGGVLNVPLKEFVSLDWRKSDALIEAGYQAVKAMRTTLLPYAVGDAEWAAWRLAGRRPQVDRGAARLRASQGRRLVRHPAHAGVALETHRRAA